MGEAPLEAPTEFDPTSVRGLVFDLDGTLIDSYGAIAASLNAARVRFGLEALSEPEVRRRVGHGLERLVAELVGPDRVEQAVRIFRDEYSRVYASGTSVLPGVAATLRALHERGYVLAVASNKPARFSRAILETLELIDLFVTVEGPDTAGVTKPEPAMVRRCLRAMRLQAGEAIYVGDMVLDVETANRAGLAVVLVPGGSCDRPSLAHTGRPLLDSLADLLELLPGSPAIRQARGR